MPVSQDGFRANIESMQTELNRVRITKHPLLCGLADRFGPNEIVGAVMDVHRFPPEFLTSMSEAMQVASHLESKT